MLIQKGYDVFRRLEQADVLIRQLTATAAEIQERVGAACDSCYALHNPKNSCRQCKKDEECNVKSGAFRPITNELW